MVLRGDHRSARSVDFVSGDGAWTTVQRALLAHSTLPWWNDPRSSRAIEVLPLDVAESWGEADRLSILAQHAAHLEFLSFCGIAESEFDPECWGLQRDRSGGVRLVRLRPPAEARAETPALTSLERMSSAVSLTEPSLQDASWTSAAWVYRGLALRLAERPASRWLRRAACGYVRSPGIDALTEWLASAGEAIVIADPEDRGIVAAVLSETSDVRVVGQNATPVIPLSAWSGSGGLASDDFRDESLLAENLIAESPAVIWVVMNGERFDSRSLTLGSLLADLQGDARWITGEESSAWVCSNRRSRGHEVAARAMVISPKLSRSSDAGRRIAALPADERDARIEEFCASECWLTFVRDAEGQPAPVAAEGTLPGEPVRSFLAALAVAGRHVRLDVASQILTRLGTPIELGDLVVPGIAETGDDLTFATEEVRQRLIASLPADTRAALASMVAEVLATVGRDRLRAAAVLFEHRAEDPLATLLLSESLSSDPRVAAELAAAQPPGRLRGRPELTSAAARFRIAEARYVDARAYARELEGDEGAYLMALIERRLGHYSEALGLVPDRNDAETAILRAELLRITGDRSAARHCLVGAVAETEEQKLRLEYESWLLDDAAPTSGLDAAPSSHWSLRRDVYRAMAAGDYREGWAKAQAAALVATDTGTAIDASLDELACRFLAGEWDMARHHARLLLNRIGRTQGDRAAVGAMLILGFVSADSGFADEARVTWERLRTFLLHDGDPLRLLESELLRAAIALAENRWTEAREAARSVLLAGSPSAELRAAAAWIDAEAAWAASDRSVLREELFLAEGRELRDRALLCSHRSGGAELPERGFLRALALWEKTPGVAPPEAETAADTLMLRRSMQRSVDAQDTRPSPSPERAAERLHRLATGSFPPESDLGIQIVSRNRLGVWSITGSANLPEAGVIRAIEAGDSEWIAIDSATWIRVADLSTDSTERRAIVAVATLRLEQWRRERIESQEVQIAISSPPIDGFVGSSEALALVRERIARIARRDEIAVTLIGESGTGKELAAVALHRLSPRRQKAFVPVNCAALPEHLIESELFGHCRGAFTGADRDRVGLIESADGGTLFLDEIGELPPAAQAKLLRFLQEKEFRRVGETNVRHADVRLVAATHRQLEEWVDEGRFRGDLFYRIRGVEIVLPPLRERPGDILEIARHVLAGCVDASGGAASFSSEVEAVLVTWNWPGNVRELQQVVRAAHALAADSRLIELEHLPERMRGLELRRTAMGSYYVELSRFRRSLIERSLDEAGGNQSQAAKTLGMTRQALAYQIRELGILVRK